jgi:hypothetical protein
MVSTLQCKGDRKLTESLGGDVVEGFTRTSSALAKAASMAFILFSFASRVK